MAEVYWIHLPEHTDVFSQGYVGFTSKTAVERFKEHMACAKSNPRNLPVYNAMRKHSDRICMKVLCICDNEYGLWLENKLRPLANTGWNSAAGGDIPHNLGRKYKRSPLSSATKAKISSSLLGKRSSKQKDYDFIGPPRKRTSQQWLQEYAESRKDTPWLYPQARRDVWVNAQYLKEYYDTNGHLPKKLPNGKSYNNVTVLNKIVSGWNPNEDTLWKEWAEQYE